MACCHIYGVTLKFHSFIHSLMHFRLIKNGVVTFMTFALFRGVCSDEIQVVGIGVPPLQILCGL